MSNLIETKEFPEDYSNDVIDILTKMSFTDGEKLMILGSMSLRSQLYAGDYDGYEIISNEGKTKEGYLNDLVSQFKKNIKQLEATPLTYIGDIKCGVVEDWRILDDDIKIENHKLKNYNSVESKKRLEYLYKSKIISKIEYENIYKKLKHSLSPIEYIELKDLCKYHIVRWKPDDILKGYTTLINGQKYLLKDGLNSKSVCKMDVVSWVSNNRFTDFSVIYQFNYNGKPMNKVIDNIDYSLKENILVYALDKNYFKMSKRIFAYSKYKKDEHMIKLLTNLFNGDLGRIYQIYGDIGTLEYIIENEKSIPVQRINLEIDQFKNRLSNITLPQYLVERTKILKVIDHLVKINKLDRSKMLKELRKLKEYLEKLLDRYTKTFLSKNNLLPVPDKYFP